MPIYEYRCQQCDNHFSHFWRSITAASDAAPLQCPACGSDHTARVVSQVTVLGEMGGLTPKEQATENAQHERMASITPKEQIDRLQTGRKKKKDK